MEGLEPLLSEHMQALQTFISVNQRLHAKLGTGSSVGKKKNTPPKAHCDFSVEVVPFAPEPEGDPQAAPLPGVVGDDKDDEASTPKLPPKPASKHPATAAAPPPDQFAPVMPLEHADIRASKQSGGSLTTPEEQRDRAPSAGSGDIAQDSSGRYGGSNDDRVRSEASGKCSNAGNLGDPPQKYRKSITGGSLNPFRKSNLQQEPPKNPEGERVTCSQRELQESLYKVKMFQRLPEDSMMDLCSACQEVRYQKGDIIIRQGDDGDEFFLIKYGRLDVMVDGIKVSNLHQGDYFGEAALLRNEQRTATIKAGTDVTAFRVTHEHFQDMGLAEKVQVVEAEDHQSTPKPHQAVFADAAAMKEKLRVAMARPPYDVRNFYWETGWAQYIARSSPFENITLVVIAINAIWIMVDTDYNTEELLLDAHPVFICAENFFCAYFFVEWLTRFLSFKKKRNCVKDPWFVFDSCLVFTAVAETWLMNIVVLAMGGAGSNGAAGDTSILRLFRLLRLSRMARMARLLKAMPELMVLIKGMWVAMRSVVFTLVLLAGIIYIFAILFTQLLDKTETGDKLFSKVPEAMTTLLLDGVLPDQSALVRAVGEEGEVYRVLIMVYILLSTITVMNMLIGVLCEVVTVVSSVEKESLLIGCVKGTLLHMLETSGLDADGDQLLTRLEFENLLQNHTAAKALSEVGVDVIGLVDFTDFIFKDGRALTFPDFMELVLQLRGTNTATVKDLVDLRKMVINELEKLSHRQTEAFEDMLNNYNPAADHMGHGHNVMSLEMAMVGNLPGGISGGNISVAHANNALVPHSQGLGWAAAASMRLSAAATELSAAAGEISSRQGHRALADRKPAHAEDL